MPVAPAHSRFPAHGMGRAAKKKIAGRQQGAGAPSDVAHDEDLVPDPTWADIESLTVAGQGYFRFDDPRRFREAMIKDAWGWAENKATDAKDWVIRAISKAVSTIVMPRVVDLRLWRDHAAQHLHRLCAHRRRLESDTKHDLEKVAERCDLLEAQVARLQSRLQRNDEDMEKIIGQIQERANLTNEQVLLLRRNVSCLEAKLTSCPSDQRNERPSDQRNERLARTRSRGRDADESCDRDLGSMIFEAQLDAISARSPSPGPERLRVWHEFANRDERRRS